MKPHRLELAVGLSEASAQQARGNLRTQRRAMPRDMIGVRMRHKSARPRIQWIQPQVKLGQMQPALETNFNQPAESLRSFPPTRKANPRRAPIHAAAIRTERLDARHIEPAPRGGEGLVGEVVWPYRCVAHAAPMPGGHPLPIVPHGPGRCGDRRSLNPCARRCPAARFQLQVCLTGIFSGLLQQHSHAHGTYRND